MLSNTELKYSQNEDNNSGVENGLKSDVSSSYSNPSSRNKSDTNVTAIKNEVQDILQLARMRKRLPHEQSRVISSQLRPDLYRIAFDDPAIDDVWADGSRHLAENCISADNEIIDDQQLRASIHLFGEIIDDQNVDLLPSDGRHRSRNNHHVYVNQLSLADEVAIAESSALSQTFHNKLESISQLNKIVDQKQNQNNRTQELFDLNEENSDMDYDLVRPHQHLSTAITNDLSENRSQRSDCNDLRESETVKRANAVSLHRLLVNSSNVMHDMPENSITSIRDCVCCSVM